MASASSNDSGQIGRFQQAARELEADDDEAAFNAKLRKIVKPKPDDKKPSDD